MQVTERQNKIVDLLIKGYKVSEIANILKLGKSTIEKELFWFKDHYLSRTLIQAIYKHYENN